MAGQEATEDSVALRQRIAELEAALAARVEPVPPEVPAASVANRMAVEQAADMISVHDGAGRYIHASASARTMIGYSPEELVGRDAYEFIHPDDFGAVRADHAAHAVAPENRRVRYRILQKDGEPRWVETGSRTHREGGRSWIICVTRDVDEQERARRRAEVAERAAAEAQSLALLARLAAALGHELSSPLLAATVGVEFVVTHFDIDEDARQALLDASEGLKRAESVIGELRLLAGLVGREDTPVPRRVDDAIATVLGLVGPWDGIEFEEHLQPVMVRVDHARLHQLAFQLLLLHGVPTRGTGVPVSVACAVVDGQPQLSVSSRGVADRAMRMDVLGVLRGQAMPMAPPIRLVEQLCDVLGATFQHLEKDGSFVSTARFPASTLADGAAP